MAKKLTDGASLLGANDQVADKTNGQIKYVSKSGTQSFVIPAKGPDGKQLYETDAKGNNLRPVWKHFSFQKIDAKDSSGLRISSSFFVADPKIHGDLFEDIVAKLNEYCKKPAVYGIYSEDDWFKNRNPEAYRIAKDREKLETELEEKERKIKELESKLGLGGTRRN